MLRFEYDKGHARITIAYDAKGISSLLVSLGQLVGERASHVHFRSSDAGGVKGGQFTLGE